MIINRYYFRDTFLIGLIGTLILLVVLVATSRGQNIKSLQKQKEAVDSQIASFNGQAAFVKSQIESLINAYADAISKARKFTEQRDVIAAQIKTLEAEIIAKEAIAKDVAAKEAAAEKEQTKGEPAVEPEPVPKE